MLYVSYDSKTYKICWISRDLKRDPIFNNFPKIKLTANMIMIKNIETI